MTGGETLLYGYGAVCVCMLIFNIIYIFFQKGQNERLDKRRQKFVRGMGGQLEIIRDGGQPEEKFVKRLEKRLHRVNNLIAFEWALTEIADRKQFDEELLAFQMQTREMIQRLAALYKDREDMQAAYFAYFIARHRVVRFMDEDAMQDIMLEYVGKNNLYCRVNAMQALYAFGTPASIARAVEMMSRAGSAFNEKILTDGLLSYKGDHKALTEALWARFEKLSTRFQLAVLNYVRFKSGDYKERMFGILTDARRDKELRLAAVRYFGRYVYEPAREIMLGFLADSDPKDWEYAAISATCLAPYEGEDVSAALMDAMHSSNWYVRYNASVSLDSRDMDYSDLIEVVGGRDRYAREMMLYRLDAKRLEQQERQEVSV